MSSPADLVVFDDGSRTVTLSLIQKARKALAEAKRAEEVQALKATLAGIQAAAHEAGNREMELDAAELRLRAMRRLGEMLREHKATIGFNKGGWDQTRGSEPEPQVVPSLAEMGIDKKLSAESQRLAERPQEDFDDKIVYWRRKHEDGKSRVTLSLYHGGDAPEGVHAPLKRFGPARLGDIPNRPRCVEECIGWGSNARHEAGKSQADLDARIGWGDTLTSKYEIPHDNKNGREMGLKAWLEYVEGIGYDMWLFPRGVMAGALDE